MEGTIEHAQNPRVRFKLGQFEFELEGPTAFEEFRRLREEGLGKLVAGGAQRATDQPEPHAAPAPSLEQRERISPNGKPSLSDLAIRNVAQSEREWVAVYSFYISEVDGKKTFSRGDIWEKYKESGRHNDSRQANLSENIRRAVEAGWLTRIKENTYAVQDEGQTTTQQIISRPSSPKKTVRKNRLEQET